MGDGEDRELVRMHGQSLSHSRKRMSVTYATCYNAVWKCAYHGTNHTDKSRSVARWALRRLRSDPRTRCWTALHLRTMKRTQDAVGYCIPPNVISVAARECTLGTILWSVCARRIQRVFVRHAWRPGGELYLREERRLFEAMASGNVNVTSTTSTTDRR